ncbi:monocarboxylate transporter 7-like isoform X3 [Apostichopus japonicus]|uniref:monocarboxylate transporter 7-like isoform X3 n=1 Tax=Stichopus japonicus TaxID=307972 RepID=UPI003AB28368
MAKNTLEKLFVSIDILFSGILVVFFQSGTFKAFGVLFDDLVIAYNTSNIYAGWIFTFQASIAYIVAGISAPLLKGFQYRSVGITGGFLFGLGFVLNGLLGKTIYQLFVFTGISGALLDISGSFTIIFSIVIFINIASIVLALGMHKMDGTIIECNE